MLNLFRRKTEKEKLEKEYKKCLAEAYALSKTNRAASDAKTAEANEVLLKIEKLN